MECSIFFYFSRVKLTVNYDSVIRWIIYWALLDTLLGIVNLVFWKTSFCKFGFRVKKVRKIDSTRFPIPLWGRFWEKSLYCTFLGSKFGQFLKNHNFVTVCSQNFEILSPPANFLGNFTLGKCYSCVFPH